MRKRVMIHVSKNQVILTRIGQEKKCRVIRRKIFTDFYYLRSGGRKERPDYPRRYRNSWELPRGIWQSGNEA